MNRYYEENIGSYCPPLACYLLSLIMNGDTLDTALQLDDSVRATRFYLFIFIYLPNYGITAITAFMCIIYCYKYIIRYNTINFTMCISGS